MEKRFVVFIVSSMVILVGYQTVMTRLNPPVPDDPAAIADGAPGADGADAEAPLAQADDPDAIEPPTGAEEGSPDRGDAGRETPGENAAEPSTVAAEVTPDEMSAADAEAGAQAGAAAVEPMWATLGSLDPERPEKLLVWFTNRGAAIECLALNDRRYTDLDDHHGYLGYLALQDTPAGLRIGAVGDGTPAARAVGATAEIPLGLRPGDVIHQLGDVVLESRLDFHQWMAKTQPGQEVTLIVRRPVSSEIQSLTYTAVLAQRPLEVIRPEPLDPTATDPLHPFSYLLTLQQLGSQKADEWEDGLAALSELKTANWEVHRPDGEDAPVVEFHFVLSGKQLEPFGIAGPLRVIKRFSLATPDPNAADAAGYHLDYRVSFRNEAAAGEPITLAYQQQGPTGLPLEGWWYTYKTHPTRFGGAGVRDVICKAADGTHKLFTNPKLVERMQEYPQTPATPMFSEGSVFGLQYVGVDAQYFASALLGPVSLDGESTAAGEAAETANAHRFEYALALPVAPKDEVKPSRTDVSFRLISVSQSIPPGGEFKQDFRIFAGPKQPDVLSQYNMGECITYGWFPIIAKPLSGFCMPFTPSFATTASRSSC